MIHSPKVIRIQTVLPGASRLMPLVEAFVRGGGGVVTGVGDGRLPFIRAAFEDEDIDTMSLGMLVSDCLALACDRQPAQTPMNLLRESVASVARSLSPDSAFRPVSEFAGTHRALAEAIDELWAHGWKPEELEDCCREQPWERRVASVADVMRAVDEILGPLNLESNGIRVRSLLEGEASANLPFDRVLVLGAHEAEPHHVEFFRWLDGQGVQVELIAEGHPTNPDMFLGTRRLAAALGLEAPAPDGPAFARSLFGTAVGIEEREVVLATSADPLAECEWALRDIVRRERQGLTWSKQGILVRSLDSYGPMLRVAAARLGVPIRLAMRVPLLENAFARLTLGFLHFCSTGALRHIEPLIQSSYLGLDRKNRERLRETVRLHQSRDRLWPELTALASTIPELAWVGRLVTLRGLFASQVLGLAAWSRQLTDWIGEMPWHEQSLFGTGQTQERDKRAQNAMQRALAQVATIRVATDDSAMSFDAFVGTCARAWDEAETTLPSAREGVVVVSREADLPEVEHLAVLGVLEGEFPRRRRESAILDDEVRLALAAARPDRIPLPLSAEQASQERDEFYRVCVAPKGSLWLSYPLTGEDRDNIPAFFLSEVERVVPGADKRDFPRTELVPAPGQCLAPADEDLARALEQEAHHPLVPTLETIEARMAVRRDPAKGVSPAELADARACPFVWFARHRTPIRQPGIREGWRRLRRIPVRARLAQQPDEDSARAAMEQALTELVEQSRPYLEPFEARMLEIGGRRLVRDWTLREFAAREVWGRDSALARIEVPLGEEPFRESLKRGDMDVRLVGHVPALTKKKGRWSLHLYEGRALGTLTDRRDLEADALLFVGALAVAVPGDRHAIEIETLSDKRWLFVMGDLDFRDDPDRGLYVVHFQEYKAFCEEVLRHLAQAADRVSNAEVLPTPGTPCRSCTYGEWCRMHLEYGEIHPGTPAKEPEDG